MADPLLDFSRKDTAPTGSAGFADGTRQAVYTPSDINKHRGCSSPGQPQPLPRQHRDKILPRYGIQPSGKRHGSNHTRVDTCALKLMPLIGRHVGDRAGACCQPCGLNGLEDIKPAFLLEGRGNSPIMPASNMAATEFNLDDAAKLFTTRIVELQRDDRSIPANAGIDPVIMRAAMFEMDDFSEGLVLKAKLLFKELPIAFMLLLSPRQLRV